MLKEFFDRLVQFATDQAKVVPSQLGWAPDSRTVLYWDPQQKKVVTMAQQPPWDRHKLLCVSDVTEYIKALPASNMPVLWIGERVITVEPNESDHTDLVTMPMRYSPLWKLLIELLEMKSVPQERAIRIIRQDFAPWDLGSAALTAVRNLKIARSGEDVSEQSHVAHRLSKSVMQDAAGASQLPEYLDIEANVWSGIGGMQSTIRVWLSIDFAKPGNIRFEPDATAMEAAVLSQRDGLATYFADSLYATKAKIYQGEYVVNRDS
jgi:hypothetical protein